MRHLGPYRAGWSARSLIAAVVVGCLVAGTVSASVTRNLTVTHAKEYSTKACVAAATWMELKQIGQTPPGQSSLYTEGLGLKSCNVGVDDGLDPRAWAYLLYYHTPGGYYYDHFKFTSAYAGTDAMVWQLFYYGEVAGALVNTGHHAFVFKGATVSCDPRVIGCNETISTVYRHGLLERSELTNALAGAHVRSVVRVRALDESFPDYLLATVSGRTGARGVALFMIHDGIPEFGAFAPADSPLPKYPSVSPSEAIRFVSESGASPQGSPELVWTWSRESGTPFMPFYRIETSNGTRYVTSGGEVVERVTPS